MTRLTVHQIGLIATVLWTLSFVLMVWQTVAGGEVYLGQWSILLALGACVATGSIIVRCVLEQERKRYQRIVELETMRAREERHLGSV